MSDDDRIRGLHGDGTRTGAGRRVPRARKTSKTDSTPGDGILDLSRAAVHPAIVVFSSDQQVVAMAAEAAGKQWVVTHSSDPAKAHEVLSPLKVRLVVIDDEQIEPATRGWLLEQIRKHAASALVVYIAAEHDLDGERRARTHPVQFYTARPLDADRVRRVLESFVRAAS
jgi:DNA-binding NtrC family response regulator